MSGFPGLAGLAGIMACVAALATASADTTTPVADDAGIVDRLGSHAVVRGNFIQTRELDNAAASLRSQGRFIFWRNHGVYWETQQPVQIARIYRHDKTLVIEDDGGNAPPGEMRGVRDRHFRETLLTVFSFDKDRLAQRFEQEWGAQGRNWRLFLTPKNRSLKSYLSMIELWGAGNIHGLRIYNDEILTLEFHDTRASESLGIEDCVSGFAYSTEQCVSLTDDSPP
ncbi:MAG: outer membrane lipoprotein carrier protein LolA [Halioglobus sp.]|nr:outer membrane lipoprotein carrier protein LolA [Halioglobus sp.]